MKLNNINPCITGRYMLFSTNSTEPTREWTRYNTSGRSICCTDTKCINNDLLNKKKKFVTLQYSENNHGPGKISRNLQLKQFMTFISGNVNTNYTRHATNTIQIGNKLFYVDPKIIEYVKEHINKNYTKEQLNTLSIDKIRNIIIEIKQKYNIQIPDYILLRDVPLSQYKTRTSYLTGSNNWNLNPTKKNPIYENPLNFDIPYQVGTFITNTTILEPFSDPNNNVFSILYNLSFNKVYIAYNDIQFLYVIQNNTCTYTGVSDNLFPAQTDAEMVNSASFWGSSILSDSSIKNFIYNGQKIIDPTFVILQPGSWKVHCGKYHAKFGLLISLYTFVINNEAAFKQYYSNIDPTASPETIQHEYDIYVSLVLSLTTSNSDLIFIPIQTQLGLLSSIQYPIGYKVNIPFITDSIDTLKSIKDELNQKINTYFSTHNVQYKLLQPYIQEYINFIDS